MPPITPYSQPLDPLLIVVGAHLTAEAHDRPIAIGLRDAIAGDLVRLRHADPDLPTLRPIVCTDVWYLNNDELRARPTVSIGGPAHNALSAYLADRLPSAFAVDDLLLVQMDPEFPELLVSCWGVNPEATAQAVDAFRARFLGSFLRAALQENSSSADQPGGR